MKQEKKKRPGPRGAAARSMGPSPDADFLSALNPRGVELLRALGQQLNSHLSSLEAFQRATSAVALHCHCAVLEMAQLLDALHESRDRHADVLAEAALLRRLVAEFAQHVHNVHAGAFGPGRLGPH